MIASTVLACGTFLLGGACGALLAHRRWVALATTIRGQMAQILVRTQPENSEPMGYEPGFRHSDGIIDLAMITNIVEQKKLEITRLSAEIESLRTLIPLLNNHSEVARSNAA